MGLSTFALMRPAFLRTELGLVVSPHRSADGNWFDPLQPVALNITQERGPTGHFPCIGLREHDSIISFEAGVIWEVQNIVVAIKVNDCLKARPAEIIGAIVLSQIYQADNPTHRPLWQKFPWGTQLLAFAGRKNSHK